MRKAVVFLLLLLFSFTSIAADSKKVAIVKAQMQVEAGEFKAAIKYLAKVTQSYPNVDVLFALYGQALYEHKDITNAEIQFRKALTINPLNAVAKSYIELIRATNNATVSEKAQQFEEISFDKIGDLVAMALAFLVASILNRYLLRFSAWRFSRKSKTLFIQGHYDDFTDLLEIQIANSALKPLRQSVNFMLQHKDPEEAIEILELYVNTEDNFQVLKRMILQDVKRTTQS